MASIITPKTIVEQRKAICRQCPRMVKTTFQCKECWCFLNVKTLVAIASCPLGKWEAYKKLPKDVIDRLTTFHNATKGKENITGVQVSELKELYFTIFGIDKRKSRCAKCVTEIRQDIARLVIDTQLIE